MSKLKVNDEVIVKKSGKTGVVKGREVYQDGNGKIRVEYVVRIGNGFNNWISCEKKELEKVVPNKTDKEVPTLVLEAPNGYKVTLVALIRKERVWKDSFDDEGFYVPYSRKGKDLAIGYAIYNPNDNYDPKLGIRIAAHRARKAPFCHLVSDFNGEFNNETVDALLRTKGEYIVRNIDKFISK